MLGTSLVKPCDDFMALVAMTSQRMATARKR